MRVRCDVPMRRSKERTSGIDEFGMGGWKCTGRCVQCICGIVMDKYGTERHVSFTRGEHNVKVYDTIEADNKEE